MHTSLTHSDHGNDSHSDIFPLELRITFSDSLLDALHLWQCRASISQRTRNARIDFYSDLYPRYYDRLCEKIIERERERKGNMMHHNLSDEDILMRKCGLIENKLRKYHNKQENRSRARTFWKIKVHRDYRLDSIRKKIAKKYRPLMKLSNRWKLLPSYYTNINVCRSSLLTEIITETNIEIDPVTNERYFEFEVFAEMIGG